MGAAWPEVRRAAGSGGSSCGYVSSGRCAAAPRPSEQPTDSDITSGVSSQNPFRPLLPVKLARERGKPWGRECMAEARIPRLLPGHGQLMAIL
jgi:hypothetical protein